MIKTTARVERAARRFYGALGLSNFDYTDHKAKSLCLGAFALYAMEWRGYDITEWEWPFVTLSNGGNFSGHEPWSVLLQRAVDLARAAVDA